jgi:preprotein translocase subunit Sec63
LNITSVFQIRKAARRAPALLCEPREGYTKPGASSPIQSAKRLLLLPPWLNPATHGTFILSFMLQVFGIVLSIAAGWNNIF